VGKKVAAGTPDEEPRRLIFLKEDIEKITRVLQVLLQNTRALGVLLVDKDGHFLTREGAFGPYTADGVSELVTAAFASRRPPVSREGLHLAPVGARTMLVIIYDHVTTAAMVRIYGDQVAAKLTELFDEIARRS